ncbi:MAG TPA: MmcQ/YjbR family DNA-binding protein [Bacteroidetes bacterium]|nr:MmcQ/YjbR family DNA-binding protein [Bacteroidota bacterium]
MNIEELREYCISKMGVTEELPFDENTLVFKVMGKMFLLIDIEKANSINIKCDPLKAIELRERYPEVLPGWHMNKRHWNTIFLDGSLPEDLIFTWIDDSYDLVVAGLPVRLQKKLKQGEQKS